MVGGTKQAVISMEFVNHHELSRPHLSEEISLEGNFHKAEMDWHMTGSDFMMDTDTGVLPAEVSMTLYWGGASGAGGVGKAGGARGAAKVGWVGGVGWGGRGGCSRCGGRGGQGGRSGWGG